MANDKNNNRTIKFDYSETDNTTFLESLSKSEGRLLNPDGTFNIERRGFSSSTMYERILGFSWTKILLFFLTFYFFINTLFAFGFLLIGPENVKGIKPGTFWEGYTQMLYFSVQTFTTVGYGHLSPIGNAANLLASVVAFIGLITFAILTGLSFAKFSKPEAHILFSDHILLAPNPLKNNQPSIQFRIVNTSKNQLIDLEARVTLTWLEEVNGELKRKFERLDLELESIHLFPLNWTIIHMIDAASPFYGLSKFEMAARHMELLILVKGYDDTYTQKIHTKRSYSFADLIEGATFTSMYENTTKNTILHLSKLNEYEPYEFE